VQEKSGLTFSMEGTMPDSSIQRPSYPTVDYVVNAIAGWVNKYRQRIGVQDEFGHCTPDEVMRIAKDLGVPVSELRALAAKGPGAADLLEKMLINLCVDPVALANANPAVMRDLQRLCVSCSQKERCQHELQEGTAAERFHEFCPNAFTLDALFAQKAPSSKH
jgi:hypothetical protein